MSALAIGKIADAVCAVMRKVHAIRETGWNKDQGYSFASDADLTRALQPAMADEGLCLLPVQSVVTMVEHGTTRTGTKQWRADVVVTYLLQHRSGESITLQAPGCGVDTQDKAVYKAMTGALKYALRQTFLVPTGEDAELDPPKEEPPPRKEPPRKEPAAVQPAFQQLADAEVEPFRLWLGEHLTPKRPYAPLAEKSVEEIEQFHRWKTTPEALHRIARWRESLNPGGTP